MKKIAFIIMSLFILSILTSCACSITNNNKVTIEVSLIAINKNTKQHIEGVKMVVIDNVNGKVIDVVTSDKNGKVEKAFTTSIDKKYLWADPNKRGHNPRGTVTIIAFKKGFNESVIFEVPVSKCSAGQPFYMEPIVPLSRNGPNVQLGNNHQLEVMSMVEKYTKYIK